MASLEMQRFLDRNTAGQDKGKDLPIEDQRRNFDAFMVGLPLPENILIDDYTLAGRPARKYFTSGVREDASLLYFHGGGHLNWLTRFTPFLRRTFGNCLSRGCQCSGLPARARAPLSCRG